MLPENDVTQPCSQKIYTLFMTSTADSVLELFRHTSYCVFVYTTLVHHKCYLLLQLTAQYSDTIIKWHTIHTLHALYTY